jgi:2,3-bisphosphoglycerate-independent phosphoglycerate mutase
MKLLFIFLDGIGLGNDNRKINPFAHMEMPNLHKLLGGKRLLGKDVPVVSDFASLISIDPSLDVAGIPQSATGQAILLTGKNVPALTGNHYGPKPNGPISEILSDSNLFSQIKQQGLKPDFVNAYPPRFFQSINNGHRLLSAIPLAATSAGLRLKTSNDLIKGEAISADFTGQGWHDYLGIPDIPILSPEQTGKRLAELAQDLDFTFFEYWLSDYAGHHQKMNEAIHILDQLDRVLDGLVQKWDADSGLILITSDHGNLEDLSTRHHTNNPVPLLLIGNLELRRTFLSDIKQMTDIAPAIIKLLAGQVSQFSPIN